MPRYLEDDATTLVLERRARLKGYELYLVEQWACSRVHPTFVITTYTGDLNHSVLVGVLSVPADEGAWSPRLRVYFKAISQFHARPKETPLGMLMVTNLGSFPSALTVIPVPDGDVRTHREDFIVNENLKRLGCSGRSGFNLATPTGATQAKFYQLYNTSDLIPLYGAVIELVKLCQVALIIFGKLDQDYADGLLCDVTEKAINDWWTEIGSEYYNIEPSDGILGPTTVAALLGLLMGARNRLNYYGAPVSKDAFDIESFKRGIAYLKKYQKMERTRRILDRQTLAQLHRVTAKAAAGEGWAVPKAVKSTVAELSGKGGDMVMGMVGGARDKAGIGDIETLDIDLFVSLVYGERPKWLWHGKAKRSGVSENIGKSLPEMGGMIFGKDDHMWSKKKSGILTVEDDMDSKRRDGGNNVYLSRNPESANSTAESSAEKDQHLRKTVFKSVTGKMSDARSGFGRIKDAVSLRGHAKRHSKDDAVETDGSLGVYISPTLEAGSGRPTSSATALTKVFTWKNKPEEYQQGYQKMQDSPIVAPGPTITNQRESESLCNEVGPSLPHIVDRALGESAVKDNMGAKGAIHNKEIKRDLTAVESSVTGSVYSEGDRECHLAETGRDTQKSSIFLYRRHSISGIPSQTGNGCNEARWPRQMSFSEAEEALLSWENVGLANDENEVADSWPMIQKQKYLAEETGQIFAHMSSLQKFLCTWVREKVVSVEELDAQAGRDRDEFESLFYQLNDAYQSVKQNSQDLLTEERTHLTDAVKDVEVLGARLEYEVKVLTSKVEEVEDAVAQFNGQVNEVEDRAAALQRMLKTETWFHWIVRSITGLGTAPYLF